MKKTEYRLGADALDWKQLNYILAEVDVLHNYAQREQFEKIHHGFSSSYKVVSAWKDEAILVGAARMVSDGYVLGVICDIAIHPDHTGEGIRREMIQRLMEDERGMAFVLMATFDNEEVYTELGYRPHKAVYGKYPFKTPYLDYTVGDPFDEF
ncbi:MAG: GNAT family N-acetyltransferase [Sumerlaeia bacterium]